MAVIGSHMRYVFALPVTGNLEGSDDVSDTSQNQREFIIPQSGDCVLTLVITATVVGPAYVELVPHSILAEMPDRWRFPLDDLQGRTTVQVRHVFAEGDILTCYVYHETGMAVMFAGSLLYVNVD